MPPIYKILISFLVCAFAVGAHVFRDSIGLQAAPIHLAGLALVMIIGLWSFPEPRKEQLRKR